MNPMPTLVPNSAEDLMRAVTSKVLEACRVETSLRENYTNYSIELLNAGKRLEELTAFTHVMLPVPEHPAIAGLPSDSVSHRESRLLAAEVATLCPIPLPRAQAAAQAVLNKHLEAWRKELKRVRRYYHTDRKARKVMGLSLPRRTPLGRRFMHVPFLRVLLDKKDDELQEWVRWGKQIPANKLVNSVISTVPGPTDVHVLLRPFICWPTDLYDSRLHVAMDGLVPSFPVRPGLRELPARALHMHERSLRMLGRLGALERPVLDYSSFYSAIDGLEAIRQGKEATARRRPRRTPWPRL